jgi:TIMELESS-interacting protein
LAAAVAGNEDVEELKLGDGDGAEALKKKVRVQKRKFDEDTLASEDGLKRIYREFPRSWKCRGRGCEGQDLAKLLTLYKSWAYQLHPGLSLPDIVKSTLKLGTKRPVRDVYGQMKDEERSRYMRDVLGFKDREPSSPDAMTSPEANSTGGDPDSTSKSVDADPFDDDLLMQMFDSAYEKEATATAKEASPALIRSSSARDASGKTPETETKSKSAHMVELDDSSDEEMDFGGSTKEGFQSNVPRAILDGSDDDEGATQEQEEEDGSTFGSAMLLPTQSDSQEFEDNHLDPTQLDPNYDDMPDI